MAGLNFLRSLGLLQTLAAGASWKRRPRSAMWGYAQSVTCKYAVASLVGVGEDGMLSRFRIAGV
jgi:hypothetical protein